jgi:ubiquinone/menaquinone biosynthesis C-methylase UbiE
MNLLATKNKWNILAQKDPLWSVLTWDDKKNHNWEANDFYKTGEDEVLSILNEAKNYGINISYNKALDFGCGAGRITSALARNFEFVFGVDISSEMISYAVNNKKLNNASYLLNEKDDLNIFQDNTFDFIISLITLQHIEEKYIKKYIVEFLRTLKPGGVLIFQLPSHPRATRDSFIKKVKYLIKTILPYRLISRYIENKTKNKLFLDMHGIGANKIRKILSSNGAVLVATADDDKAGDEWISYRYFVQKNYKFNY